MGAYHPIGVYAADIDATGIVGSEVAADFRFKIAVEELVDLRCEVVETCNIVFPVDG